MLGVLIMACMGLYIARQKRKIGELRFMLNSCLDELEGRSARQDPNVTSVEYSTVKPKAKKTPKPKKLKNMDADLDGLPIDDV